MAYELELFAATQIHPMFHAFLLKKKIRRIALPKFNRGKWEHVQLLQVLSTGMINLNGKAITWWLVHWEGPNVDDAT